VLGVSGGWPAAEQPYRSEDPVIAQFLLLVIVAIVLGIVGVVAKGLLYLLIIGIVVFVGALCWAPCGCGGAPAGARPGNSFRSHQVSGHSRLGRGSR
jgi:hypothetical protein